jgi:hypothetical protein
MAAANLSWGHIDIGCGRLSAVPFFVPDAANDGSQSALSRGDDSAGGPVTRQRRRILAAFQSEPNFGRVLAAYGGVFVAGSLGWAVVVDRFRPDRYDIVGAAVCLIGVRTVAGPSGTDAGERQRCASTPRGSPRPTSRPRKALSSRMPARPRKAS